MDNPSQPKSNLDENDQCEFIMGVFSAQWKGTLLIIQKDWNTLISSIRFFEPYSLYFEGGMPYKCWFLCLNIIWLTIECTMYQEKGQSDFREFMSNTWAEESQVIGWMLYDSPVFATNDTLLNHNLQVSSFLCIEYMLLCMSATQQYRLSSFFSSDGTKQLWEAGQPRKSLTWNIIK